MDQTNTTPMEELSAEHRRRTEAALAMGGPAKLEKRRAEGLMNARERVDALLDVGTFQEIGRFATSARPEHRHRSPADGKVTGFGQIDGREIAVVSNDFTVMGASSSSVNGRKIQQIKETANTRGLPIVFFGESTGARMPDVMGVEIAQAWNPAQYLRRRETPWVSAVLGHTYGSASWYTAMADFVVMRKGAIMAVSSPRLSALATSENTDPEQLGGWQMHAKTNGLVDVVVDSDEEAVEVIQRVLSYLPSHSLEAPPRAEHREDQEQEAARASTVSDLVPVRRNQGYDMRKVVANIVDEGSVQEFKAMYGRSLMTALARIDGRVVGVIANNPMFKGGAIDADACSKATSFLVLCDSFNIPIVLLADQPGFLIGIEAEKKAMPGRVMNWMNALSLCTVPKIAIVARKTYGQAVLNMGLAGNAHEVCAWTTAEIGFMDPSHGVTIVHGLKPEDDPQKFQELREEMAKDSTPYEAASRMGVQVVIEPSETRQYLKRALDVHELRLTNGVGQGHLRAWPTTVF
nr:carboxyl transferase domain-containing protein [Blastococcus saxobsidens]